MKQICAFLVLIVLVLIGCGGGGGSMGGDGPPTPIGNKLAGVCFGPYLKGNPDHGDTISETDLRKYLGYVSVNFKGSRVYGSTAGLEKNPAIAKSLGLKVAQGCWLGKDLSANEAEVKSLISLCQSDKVDVAIVGSETLLRGDLTEDQLIGYINRVRATGVKVTTADTWDTLRNHPAIIAACDEIWANIYPFWEGVSIDQAMQRLQSDYDQLQAVALGKKIVIAETGWPSAGAAHQAAVPSLANGAKYFADLVAWAGTRNVEFYYFEMFDEPWKTEPGLVGPHWGLWDVNLKLKSGYDAGFHVTINPANPTITVTSPADGSHSPSPLTVRCTLSDTLAGNFDSLKIEVDGALSVQKQSVPQGDFVSDPIILAVGQHQIKVTAVHAGISVLATRAITTDPPNDGKPAIHFTVAPGAVSVSGTVVNIDPTKYVVSPYIYVPGAGGWWTKPYFDYPTVAIGSDNSWSAKVVTGGIDNTGTKVAAFVILKTYSPPALNGYGAFPQELYDNSIAYLIVDRQP